jgi:CBS domain-containing protein
MTQRVSDLMTSNPSGVPTDATIQEAARIMRDGSIGDVLVIDSDGRASGILTDRDVVIRAVAEGLSPQTTVGEVHSPDLVNVAPDMAATEAVDLMRQHNVRRLPVVDGEDLVGIISLGDLAMARDPESALADISEAPPNNL